jgi:hypothetical protein
MKKLKPISFWKPVKIFKSSKSNPNSIFNFKPVKFNQVYNPPSKKISKKNLTYPQSVMRYPRLNPFGDADKDRKLNMFDCKPFNSKKHGGKSTAEWRRKRKELIGKAMTFDYSIASPSIESYKSKFIMPSGKILHVGSYSHHSVTQPTGVEDVEEFAKKTGAVQLGEVSVGSALRPKTDRIVSGVNLKIYKGIPLTEAQKQVIRELSKQPFRKGVAELRDPHVAYDIEKSRTGRWSKWGGGMIQGETEEGRPIRPYEVEEKLDIMQKQIEEEQTGAEALPAILEPEPTELPIIIESDEEKEEENY